MTTVRGACPRGFILISPDLPQGDRPCLGYRRATAPAPLLAVVGADGAHPDVAETDRVAVVLQAQRALSRVRLVLGELLVGGRAEDLGVVLHDDAVQEHGGVGGRLQAAVAVEDRGG